MNRQTTIEQVLRARIRSRGRITFAEYMQTCLYAPHGGFYASRDRGINAHFGTSPTSHAAFGALILRQLEQMWQLLERPRVFHVVEAGCGDGALARSIAAACGESAPEFSRALTYVAADYQPSWAPTRAPRVENASPPDSDCAIHRVRTEGLRAFRGIMGCILSNELIDNFPVHRFCMQDGRMREVYVTLVDDRLTEVLDDPSTPRIEQRLQELGMTLPDGHCGEVCLAMEDWFRQIDAALKHGFVLTIDYGLAARELYGPEHARGALMCYEAHAADRDPYRNPGRRDVTCLVDFTSLMQLGEKFGLQTAGYTDQRRFLENLGFRSFLERLDDPGVSAARATLDRLALMALVDPEQYGDFKVLAQAKGVAPELDLLGFRQP